MTTQEKIKRIESAMWRMHIQQGMSLMASITVAMLEVLGQQEKGEEMIDRLMKEFNIT